MKRLTTNKNVSEMSMMELAHNCCYAKDKRARYRDYDSDMDARELAIKLLDRYANIPNEFACDEDFDAFMLDALQYGMENRIGLIAMFYQNLWAMADLRERLKYYEDLEEKGKLPKLPCAVGDTVYTNLSMQPPFGREVEGTVELLEESADKLAEYEDTGLTPEQIREMDKLYVEKCKELAEAEEQQGKLPIPPCKVGDTVYRINKGARNPVIQMEIHEISIFYLKSNKLVIQMKCHDDMDMGERFYLLEEIGKNLFLTEKEAKEALKRDGENSQSKIMAEDVSGLANVFGVNFTKEDTDKLKNWIDEEEQGERNEKLGNQ